MYSVPSVKLVIISQMPMAIDSISVHGRLTPPERMSRQTSRGERSNSCAGALAVAVVSGANSCLLAPLVVLGAAVPLLWWGIAPTTSPILKLAAAQLALLALGWPLAVLLYAGGRLVRGVTNAHSVGYLLGRGLLVPFQATVAAGWIAQGATGAFDRHADAALPTLVLVALIDAMLTAQAVLLLVIVSPASLATWSDRLYLRRPPPPSQRPAAFTSPPATSGARR